MEGHSFAEGYPQVLCGRGRFDSRADTAGAVTAHYGVEGDGFYGIPLSRVASIQRDANVAPPDRACSGLRPRGWRRVCSSARWSAERNRRGSDLGVNLLFLALLLVVAGSLAGE